MSDEQQLTEADYDIDTATLVRSMGIDPATVRSGSVRLEFMENKPVLTYEVVRAVPAKLLAAAMAAASGLYSTAPVSHMGDDGSTEEQPPEIEPPTPITRKTARKAVKKAAAKKP